MPDSSPAVAELASRELVQALAARIDSDHHDPTRAIRETHISWVILAGPFAYKIKKPVRFAFVDFTSLAARRDACLEELRLNRRLTPELYLDVLPIFGSAQAPSFDAAGEPIEYAVRMRRFPPDAVLGETPEPRLTADEIGALATLIGDFHRALPPAPPAETWGRPERIWEPVAQSLEELQQVLRDDPAARSLDAIAHAMQALFRSCETLMEERRRSGAVRECHGDLHLGNLVRLDGRIVPFDALEFDPALRWIDVLNEIAFLVMDLDTRGKRSLAYHFLNRYLDETGEHEGLPVLPFYLAYRALVRAKVLALLPARRDPATRQRLLKLLEYAACPQAGNPPLLILMCGISGSGKSWIASRMAYALPAIHVRSDIERKRLFGVPALGRTDAAVGGGIYAPDASARTYRRLEAIAAAALRAGLPVIVDATNLRREHRAPFIDLARRAGRQAAIVWCRASEATLASRLRQRATAGADPSEATLEVAVAQRSVFESPEAGEADLLAISGEEEGESWEHALAAVRELASTGKAPAVQPADS